MAKERPYALMAIQTQILYDIASLLEDTGKTLHDFYDDWKRTQSKGQFEPMTVAVTERVTVLDKSNTPTLPWISFVIFNDGPDPVYIKINEKETQTHTPLNVGDQLTVTMGKDNIEIITLTCAASNNASVRIFARK